MTEQMEITKLELTETGSIWVYFDNGFELFIGGSTIDKITALARIEQLKEDSLCKIISFPKDVIDFMRDRLIHNSDIVNRIRYS